MRLLIYSVLGWFVTTLNVLGQTFNKIEGVPNISIRGMVVARDGSCWVSGTKGFVGICTTPKSGWKFSSVRDYEKFDFRDIYAFDSLHAVVMSAGSPARFLYTEDGGKSWELSFSDNRSAVFFDAIDFSDSLSGYGFSDPVDGKLVLVETKNGGKNWRSKSPQICPAVLDSEAGFAASGSSIQCLRGGYIYIGTGGKKAHLFKGSSGGKNWTRYETPMESGNSASGIFSVCFISPSHGIIAGGNYTSDSLSVNNLYITRNGGQTWIKPQTPPNGYISCVKHVSGKTWACCGTAGVFISGDDGQIWKKKSDLSFHTMAVSGDGKMLFFGGGGGKLYTMNLK